MADRKTGQLGDLGFSITVNEADPTLSPELEAFVADEEAVAVFLDAIRKSHRYNAMTLDRSSYEVDSNDVSKLLALLADRERRVAELTRERDERIAQLEADVSRLNREASPWRPIGPGSAAPPDFVPQAPDTTALDQLLVLPQASPGPVKFKRRNAYPVNEATVQQLVEERDVANTALAAVRALPAKWNAEAAEQPTDDHDDAIRACAVELEAALSPPAADVAKEPNHG